MARSVIHMVAGYCTLGVEITQQVLAPVDVHCLRGHRRLLPGVTGALRETYPGLQRVAIEPAESPVLPDSPAGTHRIEGGRAGFRPPLLGDGTFDEVRTVSTADAFTTARRAVREEGIFSSRSTGVNLRTAIRLAERLGAGHRVVTVEVDPGMKYLGGDLYKAGPPGDSRSTPANQTWSGVHARITSGHHVTAAVGG